MQRTVVIQKNLDQEEIVNDKIGLEPYANYTIGEYLDDLADEGILLLFDAKGVYMFELPGGARSIVLLHEEKRDIDPDILDEIAGFRSSI